MSFLYPLLLVGAAAIAIPIVLHMVRRKTKKRVTFSSLMFVPAAPPLLRNRSRVENVLLLILRCAIVGQLVVSLGAERLVLGTGMPFSYPDPALLKLEVLAASKEDKEKIGWRNIAQWLCL